MISGKKEQEKRYRCMSCDSIFILSAKQFIPFRTLYLEKKHGEKNVCLSRIKMLKQSIIEVLLNFLKKKNDIHKKSINTTNSI